MPKYLGVLCLTLATSACTTLGPNYAEPKVAWLNQWQTDLYGQVAAPEEQFAVDLRFWWQLFDDATLNRLIDAAKRDNVSLRIAGLRILESRAVLGIADSARYPQVQQATGAVTYINTRQQGGAAPDSQDSLVAYQSGFNLGWELDFWGRFKRGIESADAAFLASIATQQDVQVLLSAQVADLYYAYRTTELRIAIARENASIQQRSFNITQRIYESGQGSELDLQQAKTQYLSTMATIPDLQIGLTKTRNALCVLLGRPPGDLPEISGPLDALPSIKPQLIKDIPAHLLLRRPDVRAAAWQVAAQSAQVGIAEADYYPAISLLGGLAWSGSSLSAAPDTGSVSIGPSFTWNLFDHGRIGNNVRVQDARLQQAIENFQNTVLLAAQETDDAAVSVVKTKEQQYLLSGALRAAERSLKLANTRYQEGYADFQRVLDAQRSLFSQAERELVNQGQHISAVISLYKAIGGGWMDTPIEQLIPQDIRNTMRNRSDWGDLLTAPLPDGIANPLSASEAVQHE